jgi:hypothetical protein
MIFVVIYSITLFIISSGLVLAVDKHSSHSDVLSTAIKGYCLRWDPLIHKKSSDAKREASPIVLLIKAW